MISIIDPAALNFPNGQWGTCVNGQTFQQEALLTCGEHQYATWFAATGQLAVGRRRLTETTWETVYFDDYLIMPGNDAHNTASLGICEADGSLHLAFDHHCHPLHYRRSVPGVTTHPEAHAWSADLFTPITDALVPGQPLEPLTYPCFFATPQGNLQLLYRLGWSGNGDWYLAEYSAGRWQQLGMLLSRSGIYRDSINRCAYPNPLRYAPDGTLHLTWSWREPGKLDTNHDLLHAMSSDGGRTWYNGAGEEIASLPGGRPISVDTPGIIAVPLPYRWGQMNTTTQDIDRLGRVHVVCWINPRDAAAPSLDMNTWVYLHCWRDSDGTWHEQQLPFSGRKPQIVFAANGDLWLVAHDSPQRNYHGTDGGGRLRLAHAPEAGNWMQWSTRELDLALVVGEPLIDPVRWHRDGVMSLYAQAKPATVGGASALMALEPALALELLQPLEPRKHAGSAG